MSEGTKAVFLSYASQDAEAAKRIADALRAAGVEVWFDQSELRGGDAWDAMIRKRIKECALFVPLITPTTNARAEGYFRLEWKLAVDRSHLLADDHPFLFPIVLGDVTDATARVPDKFRDVQWTRLRLDETPGELAGRVSRLLSGGLTEDRGQRTENRTAQKTPGRWQWWMIFPILGTVMGLLFAALPMWRAFNRPPRGEPPKAEAPVESEAAQLVRQALALITKVGFTRDDLALAEDQARRATEKQPDFAAAWGVRAGVQAAWLFRGWDNNEKRRQDTQSLANRALALDPDEPEALLALGHMLRAQGASEQAVALLRRASAVHPEHARLARALGYTLSQQGRDAEGRAVLLATLPRAPRDPLLHYELALTYASYGGGGANPANLSAALEQLDAAIAIQPFSSALILKATLIGGWRGDLPAMRAVLDKQDRLPLGERSEDRAVCIAMWAGLLERRPDRVEAAAALTARNYFDDLVMPMRPKAWSLALAHRQAGKENLAHSDWQAAAAVLRLRLKDEPANNAYKAELAVTLAWLDQREEAARLIGEVEPLLKEQPTLWGTRMLALYYAALGDAVRAVPYLRSRLDENVFTSRQVVSLDPAWDKLRGQPEFEALLQEAAGQLPQP